MTPLIQEPLGWLALLSRPNVLLQMGLVGVVLALTLRLPLRQTLLRRLPLGVAQLPLLGLGGVLLALAGQRWGLVLLVGQILATWLGLRLLETQLLKRWLPPDQLRLLVSQVLRPLFLVGVLLVSLDALGSLQALATQPLGVWFGSPIKLGRLFEVILWLYFVVVGSALPAIW
jgi:hypothetical protein